MLTTAAGVRLGCMLCAMGTHQLHLDDLLDVGAVCRVFGSAAVEEIYHALGRLPGNPAATSSGQRKSWAVLHVLVLVTLSGVSHCTLQHKEVLLAIRNGFQSKVWEETHVSPEQREALQQQG